MHELLSNYCKYNFWANQRIIVLLNTLSDEELNKELGGSFKNILQTVHHVWKAEDIWIQRILMVEQIQYPTGIYTGSMLDAGEAWQKVSQSFIDFCNKQFDDRSFEHEVIYHTTKKELFKNTVGECIQHCMNHSTFHRGQLVNYLRMLSPAKIPSTDLITFYREKK